MKEGDRVRLIVRGLYGDAIGYIRELCGLDARVTWYNRGLKITSWHKQDALRKIQ